MNYEALGLTIKDDLKEAIYLINNPEIEPDVRQMNLEVLFRETGEQVYKVIYAMNAWDMDIEFTEGSGINDFYYGLAKNVSDSISTGGRSNTDAQIDEWLSNQILKAMWDAFTTAKENGKYPTVTRNEPANCCDFCAQFRNMTFVDPSPDVFRRHDRCKGTITTSGYKTRNGTYIGARKSWVYTGD